MASPTHLLDGLEQAPEITSAPAQTEQASPAAGALLALQASAGNHAIANHLARKKKHPKPPKPKAKPQAPDAAKAKYPTWKDGSLEKGFHEPHDHGFLDDGKGNLDPSKMRAPTAADFASLLHWRSRLEGAEILRPDLVDALKGYRHFLEATGEPLTVDYEKYVTEDWSGRELLARVKDDVHRHAQQTHNAWVATHRKAPEDRTFDLSYGPLRVGDTSQPEFPYPATENWQKAIGGHVAWVAARVTVHRVPGMKRRSYSYEMTLRMEDRYNFNPGKADLATNIADAENGRFEVTGLGKEFMQEGTVVRKFTAEEAASASPKSTGDAPDPSSR